jgi:hypothetical protein
VGVVVEPGHKNNAVNAHSPFFLQHFFGFCPEDAWCGTLLAFGFSLSELSAFWECNADEANSDAETSSNPENSLERFRLATDSQIGASGTHISNDTY